MDLPQLRNFQPHSRNWQMQQSIRYRQQQAQTVIASLRRQVSGRVKNVNNWFFRPRVIPLPPLRFRRGISYIERLPGELIRKHHLGAAGARVLGGLDNIHELFDRYLFLPSQKSQTIPSTINNGHELFDDNGIVVCAICGRFEDDRVLSPGERRRFWEPRCPRYDLVVKSKTIQ